jgi:hypothetical protein
LLLPTTEKTPVETDPPDDIPEDSDGDELVSFEDKIVEILEDAVENGIPVGVSLDDEAMTALRSVADAVHKHTAAVKEQTKVFADILAMLRTKLS